MIVTGQGVASYAARFIGVKEDPLGSNAGTVVHQFQSATGAYNAPWCVSFEQYVLKELGVGPVANRTASAYYLRDYAKSHGWTVTRPEPGVGVVYMEGAGHTGFCSVLAKDGKSFTGIEGNYNDRVARTNRVVGSVEMTFIRFPHVQYGATPAKPVPKLSVPVLPRRELVTSRDGESVSRTAWVRISA